MHGPPNPGCPDAGLLFTDTLELRELAFPSRLRPPARITTGNNLTDVLRRLESPPCDRSFSWPVSFFADSPWRHLGPCPQMVVPDSHSCLNRKQDPRRYTLISPRRPAPRIQRFLKTILQPIFVILGGLPHPFVPRQPLRTESRRKR
jgi:hypothetical protein